MSVPLPFPSWVMPSKVAVQVFPFRLTTVPAGPAGPCGPAAQGAPFTSAKGPPLTEIITVPSAAAPQNTVFPGPGVSQFPLPPTKLREDPAGGVVVPPCAAANPPRAANTNATMPRAAICLIFMFFSFLLNCDGQASRRRGGYAVTRDRQNVRAIGGCGVYLNRRREPKSGLRGTELRAHRAELPGRQYLTVVACSKAAKLVRAGQARFYPRALL
jgi:hypothetical protein